MSQLSFWMLTRTRLRSSMLVLSLWVFGVSFCWLTGWLLDYCIWIWIYQCINIKKELRNLKRIEIKKKWPDQGSNRYYWIARSRHLRRINCLFTCINYFLRITKDQKEKAAAFPRAIVRRPSVKSKKSCNLLWVRDC